MRGGVACVVRARGRAHARAPGVVQRWWIDCKRCQLIARFFSLQKDQDGFYMVHKIYTAFKLPLEKLFLDIL